MLWAVVKEDGALWLVQRPTPGVWAGLYCFALFEDRYSLQAAIPPIWQGDLHDAPVVKHVLTHKDLYLHPVRIILPKKIAPNGPGSWFAPDQWPRLGLPAPVRKLLCA
jgi:A/G-specific adenine glycosylase